MNGYKKIIKSQNLRIRILRMLSFVPDKQMLKLQYRIKMGRKLNLKKPKRFTEKLQWYKLYYKDLLMVQCVDKYDVRKYVEDKGLGHILNECYGVYETVEEIDFNQLPNQFVLKDTLGGGGAEVILVKDKATADLEQIKAQLQQWVGQNHRIRGGGREWPYYSGKKHRIIAEKYLTQPDDDLPDYKFFCFGGEVHYLYLMQNYRANHAQGRLSFFDKQFNLLPACRNDFSPIEQQPPKPVGYEEMVQMAEILSQDFPHVRVDFFNLDGKILFGELTFTTASGYIPFQPDSFDFEMGEKFTLPEKKV